MDEIYFDPGHGQYVVLDGVIVERDALYIAEKINDYDPDLQLICLESEALASIHDAPFLVIRDRGNGVFERVLEAWELDDRIIERLFTADCARNNPLETLLKMEEAQQKKKDDAQREIKETQKDLIAHAVANRKSSYTFESPLDGELVKVDDDLGLISPTERTYFIK